MAEKLERKVMEIYGENAATRDIIAYGSDIAGNIVETKDPDVIQTEAYKTGVRSAVVGNNSTTLQNRQALDFLFSRQLKYLYQHGIAEWGADETYFVNSLAVGSNGNLYVSLTDNNKGNDPVTDTTNWLSFPTPAQLAQKVAKAGDTMTGPLKMSGGNEVRFGTDDNFYYVKKHSNGDLLIYNKNAKGLFLYSGNNNFAPYYFDGTKGYRLLTTADLENIDYVVESYKDDQGNWYRKYKSGLLEQGGLAYSSSGETTVTLLKPYADTGFAIIATNNQTNNINAYGWVYISSKTTTGFTIKSRKGNAEAVTCNAMWEAKGQGAE